MKTSELSNCYQIFLGDLSLATKQICLDGKELRSTIPIGHKHALIRMVNAWVVESGLSFGQYQVGEKTNRCGDPQIVAIPLRVLPTVLLRFEDIAFLPTARNAIAKKTLHL